MTDKVTGIATGGKSMSQFVLHTLDAHVGSSIIVNVNSHHFMPLSMNCHNGMAISNVYLKFLSYVKDGCTAKSC